MTKQLDTLTELREARDEAREVLRELHGLMKDLKHQRAEVIRQLNLGVQSLVLDAVVEASDQQSARFQRIVDDLARELTDRMSARLDKVCSNLEDREKELAALAQDTIKAIRHMEDHLTTHHTRKGRESWPNTQ